MTVNAEVLLKSETFFQCAANNNKPATRTRATITPAAASSLAALALGLSYSARSGMQCGTARRGATGCCAVWGGAQLVDS